MPSHEARTALPVRQAPIQWRDIGSLVCQTDGDVVAVAGAATIAAALRARVTVTQLVPMPLDNQAWALSMDPMIAERHERIRTEARRQAEEIRRRLAAHHLPGEVSTLEAIFDEPAGLAALAARRSDLAVMARASASIQQIAYLHSIFAGMLLESGRPVLVLPEDGMLALPLPRIVVAWRDTSEATRALHDALPLLLGAGTVDILVIDPAASPLESADHAGEGMMRLLQAYDIAATVHRLHSEGRTTSRLILDYCRSVGAGLLVAGGYGHGRWREWALGGTTRELFFESHLPLLCSH